MAQSFSREEEDTDAMLEEQPDTNDEIRNEQEETTDTVMTDEEQHQQEHYILNCVSEQQSITDQHNNLPQPQN